MRCRGTAIGAWSLAAQPGANRTSWAAAIGAEYLAAAEARWGRPRDKPWQGALPSLYAAVAAEAGGGKFYSPDQNGGYRGYPPRPRLRRTP